MRTHHSVVTNSQSETMMNVAQHGNDEVEVHTNKTPIDNNLGLACAFVDAFAELCVNVKCVYAPQQSIHATGSSR